MTRNAWVSALMRSSSPAGREGNHAVLLSSVNTSQNEQVNNPAYAVPNQVAGGGVVYEDQPSEYVAVRAPAVTAFTSDEGYSKLQRDSSVLTQSTTTPITGDGYNDVEAYYGRLDNTEQYIVSIVCCGVCCFSLGIKCRMLEQSQQLMEAYAEECPLITLYSTCIYYILHKSRTSPYLKCPSHAAMNSATLPQCSRS